MKESEEANSKDHSAVTCENGDFIFRRPTMSSANLFGAQVDTQQGKASAHSSSCFSPSRRRHRQHLTRTTPLHLQFPHNGTHLRPRRILHHRRLRRRGRRRSLDHLHPFTSSKTGSPHANFCILQSLQTIRTAVRCPKSCAGRCRGLVQ